MKGKLYLIPSPLGDNDPAEVLPASTLQIACSLQCFVVEELRTVRRFLSRAGLRGHIDLLPRPSPSSSRMRQTEFIPLTILRQAQKPAITCTT